MTNQNDIAIQVNNVSKSFKLPHEKHSSIKGAVVNVFKSKRSFEQQQVLEDISFEIKKGEFFGIVGRNGSGKSTLLKLLAGIYTPDEGSIEIEGRLTPFIELGVGFNPELTGRENVFMNGALLGFNRSEVEAMYDEIVEFAELKKFMDQKLKNYSSGMQVRLAFSIAIRAQSDILLLDEVLAVGDAAFQRKCFDYFKKLKRQKATVVFVSHDMQAVQEFCDRALLIKKGEIVLIGDTFDVAKLYNMENLQIKAPPQEKTKDLNDKDLMSVSEIKLLDEMGKSKDKFSAEDTNITLEVRVESKIDITHPVLGIIVNDSQDRPIVAFNTKDIQLSLQSMKKGDTQLVTVKVQNVFNDGNYYIQTSVRSFDRKTIYSMQNKLSPFGVSGRTNTYGIAHPVITKQ